MARFVPTVLTLSLSVLVSGCVESGLVEHQGEDSGTISDSDSDSDSDSGTQPDSGSDSGSAPPAAVTSGNLLFPNAGLNAIVEFDPVARGIVQTIPIPAPYNYGGSPMLYTALVRASDHGILVNVRSGVTEAFLLALDSSGGLVAAENVDQEFLQQLLFDPRDPAEDSLLAGTPFSNRVDAANAYARTQAPWAELAGANFIGIAKALDGTVLAGTSGQGIGRYGEDGTLHEVFVDLASSIGIEEVNGMAVDDVGNVYLAQNSSGHVAVFDASGEFLQFLTAASFNHPVDVYYSPDDGLLYVGNKSDGVLTVLSTDGTVEAVVELGGAHIGTAGRVP